MIRTDFSAQFLSMMFSKQKWTDYSAQFLSPACFKQKWTDYSAQFLALACFKRKWTDFSAQFGHWRVLSENGLIIPRNFGQWCVLNENEWKENGIEWAYDAKSVKSGLDTHSSLSSWVNIVSHIKTIHRIYAGGGYTGLEIWEAQQKNRIEFKEIVFVWL